MLFDTEFDRQLRTSVQAWMRSRIPPERLIVLDEYARIMRSEDPADKMAVDLMSDWATRLDDYPGVLIAISDAIKQEREACAKLATSIAETEPITIEQSQGAYFVEDAIRKRGVQNANEGG